MSYWDCCRSTSEIITLKLTFPQTENDKREQNVRLNKEVKTRWQFSLIISLLMHHNDVLEIQNTSVEAETVIINRLRLKRGWGGGGGFQIIVQPHVYFSPRRPFFCFPHEQFVMVQHSGFSSRQNKESVPFCGLLFLSGCCCSLAGVEGLL